ncbi:hypothetical protein QFZ75_008037 [Streptomyces sp. V3I8]|uniref:hypothetical protein n=1 Tax=Streptomyces sp. V3I8 TaxID=3042279 RepID=UPI0027894698|nr:hypothetical protein [Streptomyces sp. V3I8]MDQ1041535.1 hypothetical protein [Streptomyces sp. V3I8]
MPTTATPVERASAILSSAGYARAVTDERGYTVSPGWSVTADGEGRGAFVQAEPVALTEEQGRALQAAPDFAARQVLVDEQGEERAQWASAQLAEYRRALEVEGWYVRHFASRSAWNMALAAWPAKEPAERGS